MDSTEPDRGYWNATAPDTRFPRLEGKVEVDVAIVGGGIVGVTAARLLKDRGMTVAVVEALRVGRQVTGMSTAKVTSQHGLKYRELADRMGEDQARLYAEAQQWGVDAIRSMVESHAIRCGFLECDAFVYTREDGRVADLQAEAEIARALGLPAELVFETDLPFDVAAALRFERQARFHPVRYVAGLAETVAGDSSHVFENSRAMHWSRDRVWNGSGTVSAGCVIMATHLPPGQIGGSYMRAFPRARPMIAARVETVPAGRYICADEPLRSINGHRAGGDGAHHLIVCGQPFKPGHYEDERDAMRDLEDWLGRHFAVDAIIHRWVNEDYRAMDGVPFVGWSSSGGERYLVATGFDAWGISNGTAAGRILADLAAGEDHPWTALFDAARIRPIRGGASFLQENLSSAWDLASGYLTRKRGMAAELEPGEAAIVHQGGENVAVCRDHDGSIHAVAAACTHMGCLVGWNATDRTWDCPCHGSRFSRAGDVLHGPATKPLMKMKVK